MLRRVPVLTFGLCLALAALVGISGEVRAQGRGLRKSTIRRSRPWISSRTRRKESWSIHIKTRKRPSSRQGASSLRAIPAAGVTAAAAGAEYALH
jgi:hypothetical protein